jgi:hypothetical protein
MVRAEPRSRIGEPALGTADIVPPDLRVSRVQSVKVGNEVFGDTRAGLSLDRDGCVAVLPAYAIPLPLTRLGVVALPSATKAAMTQGCLTTLAADPQRVRLGVVVVDQDGTASSRRSPSP